jgi:16S rRNA (guanine(966)-N(2))-methyltransferase RsmD
MRIITGTARGRKLEAVPGQATRPTADKVKQSVFNILQFDIEGRAALDLFAGTGQMGLEALSRGAVCAVFVENGGGALAVLRRNIERTGFQDRAEVAAAEAFSFLAACGERFDLIFLDPPYGGGLAEKALRQIAAFDILREGGIMVCEHGGGQALPVLPPPYRFYGRHDYGAQAVSLWTRREEGP